MRKSLLLCTVLLFAGTLLAQGRWSAGVDAQIGFTGISKDDVVESEFTGTVFHYVTKNTLQPAAGAGMWGQYQLTRGVGIRLGLGYLNSSNEDRDLRYSEVTATGQRTLFNDETYRFRAHQIQMPLELVLEPGTAEVRMIFSVGAQINASWLGSIYHTNNFPDAPHTLTVWTPENSNLTNQPLVLIQPVASIGLRINDQMNIRLRNTWAKPQRLGWTPIYDENYVNNMGQPGVIICFAGEVYGTTSSYQRLTSLQFTYRIF